jgi:hypothetical protein
MISSFTKIASRVVRAAAATAMVALAAFLMVGPMGCGRVDNSPTLPVDDGTGSTGTSGSESTGTADANGDQINAADVSWSNRDLSQCKVTAKLKSVSVTPNKPAPTICWERETPNWPHVGRIDASMFVIANIGGKWYGSVWEHSYADTAKMCRETEAGNTAKGGHSGDAPFIQTETKPISTWFPQSGEKVCWAFSIVSRGEYVPSGPKERTQILCQNWP